MKRCATCKEVKPPEVFGLRKARNNALTSSCNPCMAAKQAKRRKNNLEEHRRRDREWYHRKYGDIIKGIRKRLYGLSPEQFSWLVTFQKGHCALCDILMKSPCIDHDHQTGKVRGLLCQQCNLLLYYFESQTPEKVLKFETYLSNPPFTKCTL